MLTVSIETEQMSQYASDADRWDAVTRRDRRAAGAFYYAVTTTGVYCRPGCAARLPRRENVTFYPSPAAAEQAGFRPCKRCRPRTLARTEQHAATVAAACRRIETAAELPDLDTLAAEAGMSRFHFHRIFKAATGITPKAYAAAQREQRVRDRLTRSNTVTEAIYEAGFNSNGRFYAASDDVLGMTPTAWREGGRGMTIRFAVGQCWLGSILVAASDRGVCAIAFDDDPETLVYDLQDRFSKARLIGGDSKFEDWVARVIGFVAAPARGLDLPLDIRGTAFQRRVWQALRDIPFGSTASYAEIAESIGKPKAARAVARACATNPLAVAIPCHRVVRTDGALSGYRWGLERKRALLEREAAAAE
jgi:AraC family transcriptional regulator of adaptative response/methylated-DNA-[protein]-cysteine methyltransferase